MTEEAIRKEEIRLSSLPKLQKLFREKMGEWKVGDKLHDPLYYSTVFTLTKQYVDGSFVASIDGMEIVYWNLYQGSAATRILRLPLAIDPFNPERGLWGMVDWSVYHTDIMPSGDLWIYAHEAYRKGNAPTIIGSPTLALLKALAVQEGAEV